MTTINGNKVGFIKVYSLASQSHWLYTETFLPHCFW